jgi:hypothetical protein
MGQASLAFTLADIHARAVEQTNELIAKCRILGPRLNGEPATIEETTTRTAKMVRLRSAHDSAVFPLHIAEIAATKGAGNFLTADNRGRGKNLACLLR